MAASEVLARVADVASSDLLDFIVELAHRLLHRQPSSAQILTADSVQQPPIAAPGGSEINHGIHRNPRKKESESTPPFCVRRCFPWLPVCDDLSCRSNTASIPMPS